MSIPQPLRTERPVSALAETISDRYVREMFDSLVELLGGLHNEVTVSADGVDVRVEYSGRQLCRLVPYRELIHIQIGDGSVWEIRVRDETTYFQAADRILRTFVCFAAFPRSG